MFKKKSDLFAEMAKDAFVITPNNRLSNQLLRGFKQDALKNVIDKPRCMPYSVFLRHCFQMLQYRQPQIAHPMLLDAHQVRVLWKNIIDSQGLYPSTEGLLQQVQEAWMRCQIWELDVSSEVFFHSPQTRQFQKWSREFQNKLNELNAIVDCQIISYCLQFTPPLQFSNIQQFVWVSFDDFTPQQRKLREALKLLGYHQQDHDLAKQPVHAKRYAANDSRQELEQLVVWLRQHIDAKTPRVGVIVPDLQQQSQALQRYLLRKIPSDYFDISLGKPITEYPLISHALHWLSLDKKQVSQHQMRLLLHSPYLGGAVAEFSARAKFLEESPLLQEANVPFATLLEAFQSLLPVLADKLENLSSYPEEAAPGEWISQFQARLTMLGFPGEYSLNSAAYQYFQRFQNIFDDFRKMTLVRPKMNNEEALNVLHAIAKTTIFQIKKAPASIQILGLLEASGCEFDAVWVMGLTDQCLPQKTNLNPFIPMHIQREQRMPHALPERELHLATQLLERLQNGSEICIFSYPKLTGDAPNLPSPLVRDLPLLEHLEQQVVTSSNLLNSYQESYLQNLVEGEVIFGGTALLANQAKCPFRAFAAHRLHAKAGLKQSTGLNDAERGQVAHKILEVVWKALDSQQRLLNITSVDLDALIMSAIETALSVIIPQRIHSFSPLIQTIEKERLYKLIHACLEWEKQRPPFSIKAIEQTFSLNLAGLDFRVRVDRIDTHENDEAWVIDYKSSLPPNKPWNDERPEAPQLLLYALLDPTITALLFLQLKAGQMICSGISQGKHDVSGLSGLKKEETWKGKIEDWHRRLEQLAIEFRDGYCTPSPQRESTCLTCEFKDLCRV